MASRPEPGPGLDVLGDQLVDEVEAGLRVLAAVALGGVRRQQVPLGRAGAQRARGDHLEAGLQQVVPVLDVLRVALADDEGHHRTERDALGGVGVPVLGDLVGLDQPGDVGLDGEVDDVGGLAVDDAARLVAGGAVGRRHGDALALGGGGEGRDDLAPAWLRHGVGHQGQRGVGRGLVAATGDVARRRHRTRRAGMAVTARAPTAVSDRIDFGVETGMGGAFPCGDSMGCVTRHDGKETYQCSGTKTAATDTKPRNGMGVSDNSAHRRQRNCPRR